MKRLSLDVLVQSENDCEVWREIDGFFKRLPKTEDTIALTINYLPSNAVPAMKALFDEIECRPHITHLVLKNWHPQVLVLEGEEYVSLLNCKSYETLFELMPSTITHLDMSGATLPRGNPNDHDFAFILTCIDQWSYRLNIDKLDLSDCQFDSDGWEPQCSYKKAWMAPPSRIQTINFASNKLHAMSDAKLEALLCWLISALKKPSSVILIDTLSPHPGWNASMVCFIYVLTNRNIRVELDSDYKILVKQNFYTIFQHMPRYVSFVQRILGADAASYLSLKLYEQFAEPASNASAPPRADLVGAFDPTSSYSINYAIKTMHFFVQANGRIRIEAPFMAVYLIYEINQVIKKKPGISLYDLLKRITWPFVDKPSLTVIASGFAWLMEHYPQVMPHAAFARGLLMIKSSADLDEPMPISFLMEILAAGQSAAVFKPFSNQLHLALERMCVFNRMPLRYPLALDGEHPDDGGEVVSRVGP